MEKFFDQILQAVARHIDFKVVKCVIVASPGFVKDQLTDYMFKMAAQKEEYKHLLSFKQVFLTVHSSSGHK
jgi:protein pelota